MNKRIILMGLMILLLASSAAYATVFDMKYLAEGSSTLKTKDKSSDKHLWQSTITTKKIKYQGKDFLYAVDSGSGIWGKDKKPKTWRTESYALIQGNRIIPYSVKVVFKDKQGKVLRQLEKFYDLEKKKVFCDDNGKAKKYDFKDDLLDKEFMGVAQSNYPFAAKKDYIYHILTHEPTLYKITLKYRGKEVLRTQGKEIECHKIQMIPDLGALNIFGAFVPKTYFWYETKPPHEFVRYEGLESGLGTPYVVMEAVD
ncbi:hypothetical protein ACFL5U_04125 [Candidatus Margulisiibacteriota bacterium]